MGKRACAAFSKTPTGRVRAKNTFRKTGNPAEIRNCTGFINTGGVGTGLGLIFDGINDFGKISGFDDISANNSYYEVEFFWSDYSFIGMSRKSSADTWSYFIVDHIGIYYQHISQDGGSYRIFDVWCPNTGSHTVRKIKFMIDRIRGIYKIFINDVEQVVTTQIRTQAGQGAIITVVSQPYIFTNYTAPLSTELVISYHNDLYQQAYYQGQYYNNFTFKKLSDNAIKTYNMSQGSGTTISDSTDGGNDLIITGATWGEINRRRINV